MKCEPKTPSSKCNIQILKKERNEFAKSRQQWIQAAFDLYYKNDAEKFNELTKELCDKCVANYKI